MNKTLKAVLSLILSLVLVCSLASAVFAEGCRTIIRDVHEAYNLVVETDLIAIYKATLHSGGKSEDVYYVVCKGLDFTAFDPEQPRSYANAIKIGLSCENNTYVKTLTAAVKAKIPEGEKIVFLGHSMGGMVIQQVIANSEIKAKYDILYSTAIGSPYILTKGSKEGTLRRVVDRLDPVPFLSIPLLANPTIGNVSLETSFLAPLVHFRSYEKGSCWNGYDCLGVKNGGAYVELGELIYYACA